MRLLCASLYLAQTRVSGSRAVSVSGVVVLVLMLLQAIAIEAIVNIINIKGQFL